MKRLLLLSALFLLTTTAIFGQKRQQERVKLLKTSFITDALMLSSSEAEKFWPIYNKYSEKIISNKNIIERQMMGKYMLPQAKFDLNENDARVFITKVNELEADNVKNQQLMNEELSNVISSKKILRLLIAERNFNRRILQEFGRRARNNRNK